MALWLAQSGLFAVKKGNRRLVVGVELLGQSICADLDRETVEP